MKVEESQEPPPSYPGKLFQAPTGWTRPYFIDDGSADEAQTTDMVARINRALIKRSLYDLLPISNIREAAEQERSRIIRYLFGSGEPAKADRPPRREARRRHNRKVKRS